MGKTTRGKQKVTVELDPKTVDLIEAFTNQPYTPNSKGQVIDSLTTMFLGTNPSIALSLMAVLTQMQYETNKQIANDAQSKEELIQIESDYTKMSRHFAALLTDGRVGVEFEKRLSLAPQMRILTMSNGKREAIRSDAKAINPSKEGKTKFCYLIWQINHDSPINQEQALSTQSPEFLAYYFSDRDDLHVFGQCKPHRFADDTSRDECWHETEEILDFIENEKASIFRDQHIKSVSFAWELIGGLRNTLGNVGKTVEYRITDFERTIQ